MFTPTGMLVVVRGTVNNDRDPLFDRYRVDHNIVKQCRIDEVNDTVVRWLALGRTITGISYR